MKKLLIATAVLLGILNLSGCTLVLAGGGYHYEQGDLVSADGTVRYMGWCNVHPHNSHCQPGIAVASGPSQPRM
jgi:hypothetical protein